MTALLISSILAACGDSDDPATPDPTEWRRLDLAPAWVTALDLSANHLVISGGISGVFIQSPPIDGPIDFAGSDFPELGIGDLSYGVYAVEAVDGTLYRAFRGPVNHAVIECGGLGPPYQSVSCSAGITPRGPNDLMALPSGKLLLVTSGSVYRRGTADTAWTETKSNFGRAVLSRDASAIVYLATDRMSRLDRSIDDGQSWRFVTSAWPPGINGEDVRTMSTTSTGDTVMATTPAGVILSLNGGATFGNVRPLTGPSAVRLEPVPPYRCLVLADSLYESADLGASWSSRPLPGRPLVMAIYFAPPPPLPWDVSWESSTIVIGRLGHDNAEVWTCQFD